MKKDADKISRIIPAPPNNIMISDAILEEATEMTDLIIDDPDPISVEAASVAIEYCMFPVSDADDDIIDEVYDRSVAWMALWIGAAEAISHHLISRPNGNPERYGLHEWLVAVAQMERDEQLSVIPKLYDAYANEYPIPADVADKIRKMTESGHEAYVRQGWA